MKSHTRLLLVLLIALLLQACASSSQEPTELPPLEITLIATDFNWIPAEISAAPGQKINITITNDGLVRHNLEIPELNIDVNIEVGESKTVSFVATESGTLEFICNEPGHEELGMIGTITIGE